MTNDLHAGAQGLSPGRPVSGTLDSPTPALFNGLLSALALLAAVGIAALMVTNAGGRASSVQIGLVPLVGFSYAAAGWVALRLRADNPIGTAMLATSLLWSASALFWSQDPLVFSIGHAFESFYLAGIVYILLSFPAGRLTSPAERFLALLALLAAGPAEILFLVLGGHAVSRSCVGCPAFVFQLADAGGAARGVQAIQHLAGIAAIGAAIVVLVRRWRAASGALRFAIAPVLWTGTVVLPVFAFWVVDDALGAPLGPAADAALDLGLIAIAWAFLAGIARTHLARSSVADLMLDLAVEPGPGTLERALARALHDPSLEVAYWLPDGGRFVDAQGFELRLPQDDRSRAITMIERDGRRIAALIHDPALEDEHLVRSACAAAALSLENERLQAELRAQLAEVRESRARIVSAAQDERRRIERDLHDGTQQRLVSIAMTLGLAAATDDRAATGRLVDDARSALSEALTELRELSQGIHPAVLTERGLPAALEDLALRMRMDVELDVVLDARLPAAVEAAAYYFVAEALTNSAKHAAASTTTVSVRQADGVARIDVADDGRGGADVAGGSGLRGLRDRVEALGGRLILESPGGGGTRLRAEIPCA